MFQLKMEGEAALVHSLYLGRSCSMNQHGFVLFNVRGEMASLSSKVHLLGISLTVLIRQTELTCLSTTDGAQD